MPQLWLSGSAGYDNQNSREGCCFHRHTLSSVVGRFFPNRITFDRGTSLSLFPKRSLFASPQTTLCADQAHLK